VIWRAQAWTWWAQGAGMNLGPSNHRVHGAFRPVRAIAGQDLAAAGRLMLFARSSHSQARASYRSEDSVTQGNAGDHALVPGNAICRGAGFLGPETERPKSPYGRGPFHQTLRDCLQANSRECWFRIGSTEEAASVAGRPAG
jgi:hypothetical protein